MSLATPAKTIAVLKQFNLHLSKSMGQNFLVDENVLRKIVDFAEPEPGDAVLEIGPGIGTLTQSLAENSRSVIAVEYDKTFFPVLKQTLSAHGNVTVFHSDALDFDLKSAVPEALLPNKMVSNLPYSIAAPLLIRYLQEYLFLSSFVIMLQKEVGSRIMAKPSTGDYSSLSLLLQYYAEPIFGFYVSRKVFIPAPHVDSVVIKLKRLARPAVDVGDEALLFKLIRAAFGQRRKTIRNALSGVVGAGKGDVESVLDRSGIDSGRRGETLSLEEFAAVCRAFEELDSS